MHGSESIIKVFSYIVFTFVVILCVSLILIKVDGSRDTYVTSQTTSFCDSCRTTGRIDPQLYESFAESVYQMDYYDIDIFVKHKVTYPDKEGSTRTDYITVNMGTLLDTMYGDGSDEPQAYLLGAQDMIYVKITRIKNGTGTSLLNLITNVDETGIIVCNYGGMVGEYGD